MGLRAACARHSRRRSSRTAPPLPPTAGTPGRAHDGSTRSTTLGDGSGSGRRVSRGALRGANGCFAPTTTPMGRAASGHVEQLPSGSFRVEVHAGTDPLTGRRLRFRQTVKTGKQAQIVLAACSSRPLPDSSRTRASRLPGCWPGTWKLPNSTSPQRRPTRAISAARPCPRWVPWNCASCAGHVTRMSPCAGPWPLTSTQQPSRRGVR